MQFLDERALRDFPTETFTGAEPFPWHNFSQLLTPEGFAALHEEYPALSLFDKHVGMERIHGQRPHDRYYLAYEHSIYDPKGQDVPGEVKKRDLPLPWQGFMEELQTSQAWMAFAERLLGQSNLTARYAWHVGINGSEVSPHRDADNKIGTHIFYFNTSDDWDMTWGGSTLALGGKKTDRMNPDFSEFATEEGGDIRDNHSFLFKNTPNAWHGVRTLTCPEGSYRRLFNVIFHADEPKRGGIGTKLKQMLGGKRTEM